jgi:ribosome maturation factor RimP
VYLKPTPVSIPTEAPERKDFAPGRGDSNAAIERTVTGLGYELVDVERLARGLLRVTIDRIPGRTYGSPGGGSEPADDGAFITVEDCERVTRQLQLALEVAAFDYARLEVSSPGLDRPLKTEAHCRRFVGQAVKLTLKLPFQKRKHWTGVLEANADHWRLVVAEDKDELALDFRFDEVRDMHLVPVLDFKGRRRNASELVADEPRGHTDGKNAAPAADAALNGEQDR